MGLLRRPIIYTAFLVFLGAGEPLVRVSSSTNDLEKRDTAWTTLAFQTKCDNINFMDYTDCCQKKSGPTWRSCNNAGSWMLGSSTVLCYSIPEGHTCCADNSVCDKGLACKDGTCSQTEDSVTVCEDGCVSFGGQGCKSGTCFIDQYGETSHPAVPSPTIDFRAGDKSTSEDSSSTSGGSSPSSSPKPSSGGLGTGAIFGIVASVLVAILGGIFGCWLKMKRYKNKEARDMVKTQVEINRMNSTASPVGPPPPLASPLTPQPYVPPQYGGYGASKSYY